MVKQMTELFHYMRCKISSNYEDNVTFKKVFEPQSEKNNNVVFELFQHQPSCRNTEDGWRLENLGLETRGIVLSV